MWTCTTWTRHSSIQPPSRYHSSSHGRFLGLPPILVPHTDFLNLPLPFPLPLPKLCSALAPTLPPLSIQSYADACTLPQVNLAQQEHQGFMTCTLAEVCGALGRTITKPLAHTSRRVKGEAILRHLYLSRRVQG